MRGYGRGHLSVSMMGVWERGVVGINCGGLNLYSETRVVMDSDRVTLLLLYGRVAGINRKASTGLSSSLCI